MQIMFDSSRPIEESYADVRFTLILTLVLVVLVIFVFLRNLSATVIPSLSLPMSLVGTFIAMRLLDYSLDNLSLMALTLAIGFVVDDAIVVLENIVRHMDTGKTRLQAALDATREIGFTVVSMTVSLAAVFIPVLFMGGLVGRIFREFAVTIGVAVLVSGVVALTLIPMLAARFLRASSATRHGQAHGAGRGIGVSLYGRSLWWVLRHGPLTMVVAALTLALTVVLFRTVPKGFVPTEDRGYFRGQTEAAEGTSHVSMFRRQQAVAAVLQQDPAVDAFMSRAGSIGGRTTNAGGFFVRLKPRSERKESAEQIIQRLRPRFGAIPGVRVFAQSPAIIQVGGRMSRSQYQYTLMGPDTDDLYRYGAALQERFQTFPGFLDVNSDVQLKNPELTVEINRDLAATLGVSAEQIEDTLLAAYGSSQVSTIFAPNNQYQVIVEFPPELQLNAEALSLLHVRSDSGRLVPLRVLAELRTEVGPLSINHSGQLPSVTLSFNLQPGTSIGEAIGRIEKAAREILPPTVSGSFQGTAQAFQSSLRDMGMLLILAIVVIYMVLGVLYENFYHPVTILSALPFAGLGALLALQMAGAELSIYAFVGIIMLVGLVKKNGIMMVDFAIEAQRSEGKPPTEAIHQACMVRFRPIMMTTVAALMAGLPIALGFGAGAESRRPLGLAVVGGLLFSQTLTLYVTPVFYLYMDRLQTWVRTRAATPESAPVGVAARE
jgi:HAE1 family hydrophobic/amphiphilic exporter-1